MGTPPEHRLRPTRIGMPKKDDLPATGRAKDPQSNEFLTRSDGSRVRILVAWQPGVAGDEAVDTAAWLAKVLPARVRAVSTLLRLWPTTSLSKLGSRYDKWLNKQTKAYNARVREAFGNAGIDESHWDSDVAVVADGPNESSLLNEAATEFGADLLVVGSRPAAAKGRFLSGTTTDALLHSATTPLLLAPRSVKLSKRGVTRVNVAYLSTKSEEVQQALFFGGQLAQRLGVPLRLVAFSPTGLTHHNLDDRIDLSRELSDEWYEHALGMLDRARDLTMETLPDLDVHTALGSGAGWPGAVDALKWKKGDLLCMGSTIRGPFERVFLGSTEAQFLQHVSVPVIVLPAPTQP